MSEETQETVKPDEVEAVEDNAFHRTVPLLMDSYQRGKGRTFDPDQVAGLAEGLLEMAMTIDGQVTEIGRLQQELEEAQAKRKLWRPNA